MNNYLDEVNQLFFKIIQNGGELHFKDEPKLFSVYRNQEAYPLIKSFETSFKCQLICRDNNVLYLIPEMDNDVLGITEQDIRKIHPNGKTNITKVDVYLSYYIMIFILNSFYTVNGVHLVPFAKFLVYDDVVARITQRLSDAKDRVLDPVFQEMNENSEHSLTHEMDNIKQIAETWAGKIGDKFAGRKSREDFVDRVVKFLVTQNLIEKEIEGSNTKLYPTERLSAVMSHIVYGERENIMNMLIKEVDWETQPNFKEEKSKSYGLFQENIEDDEEVAESSIGGMFNAEVE